MLKLLPEIRHKMKQIEEAGLIPKILTVNEIGMQGLITDFKTLMNETCLIETTTYGIPKSYYGLPICYENELSEQFLIGV